MVLSSCHVSDMTKRNYRLGKDIVHETGKGKKLKENMDRYSTGGDNCIIVWLQMHGCKSLNLSEHF